MSKEYSLNIMPSVSVSRSRFARKSQHKTSINLGFICPIYVDEVLPGDTMSMDMASLVRMSTPIAPIMDNIYMDYFAFFVPNRLVWEHWKEFMGENSVSAGIPSSTYTVPSLTQAANSGEFGPGTIGNYFGLPYVNGVALGSGSSSKVSINALPFRGYYLIYNEFFRDQNLIAPIAINKGDTDGVIIGSTSDAYLTCEKAAKLSDYFTRALPYAQKGTAVSIPMGTTAPVYYEKTGASLSSGTAFEFYVVGQGNDKSDVFNSVSSSSGGSLVADLSNATAATINQLRYAFQLQKLLERDAIYGSRYFEILAAHFGVISPDARLQRPEYLGGWRQRINVDQVLSTAGYANTSLTTVGAPGANSVTGGKNSIFTKSFVEHGYVFILAVARHDQTYTQGVNRMWSRTSRYDFYFPVFANLGAQDIKNQEIFLSPNYSDNQGIFGYQEAWAEYRMKPSICTGILSPSYGGSSLKFWTLSNNFASLPTLGQTFIEQGRDNLGRALVTSTTGPDFICDFYFENICVRPMPMYSIPGLIDHH